MATIASLAINLTAGTAAFIAGMKKAQNSTHRFGASCKATGAHVYALGASALGALGGFAAFTLLIKKSASSIDEAAKAADRLGISTEALAGFAHAGDLAGVSSEELVGALTKMEKNLGTAAIQGGAVSEMLTAMGLDAQELTKMAPDQAFMRLADSINQLNNPTEKTVAAMAIFGRTGNNLLPMLAGGSAGLKEMAADAVKLGLSFDRISAAQVEQANDAITRLGNLFTGIGNQLIIGLAPYIEAAANKLTDMGIAGLDGGQTISKALEWVANGVAYVTDFLKLFEAGWYLLKTVVLGVSIAIVDTINYIGKSVVDLINLLPGVEVEWTDTFSNITQAMQEDFVEATNNMGEAWDGFVSGENQNKVKSFFAEVRKQSAETAKAVNDKQVGGMSLAEGMKSIEQPDKAEIGQITKQIGIDYFRNTTTNRTERLLEQILQATKDNGRSNRFGKLDLDFAGVEE